MSEHYRVILYFGFDNRIYVKQHFKNMRQSGKIYNKPRLYFADNTYNPITGKSFDSFMYVNLKVLKAFLGEL